MRGEKGNQREKEKRIDLIGIQEIPHEKINSLYNGV